MEAQSDAVEQHSCQHVPMLRPSLMTGCSPDGLWVLPQTSLPTCHLSSAANGEGISSDV